MCCVSLMKGQETEFPVLLWECTRLRTLFPNIVNQLLLYCIATVLKSNDIIVKTKTGRDVNGPLGICKFEVLDWEEKDSVSIYHWPAVRLDHAFRSQPTPPLSLLNSSLFSWSILHAYLSLLGDQTAHVSIYGKNHPSQGFLIIKSVGLKTMSPVSPLLKTLFSSLPCIIEVLGKSEMLWLPLFSQASCNLIVS